MLFLAAFHLDGLGLLSGPSASSLPLRPSMGRRGLQSKELPDEAEKEGGCFQKVTVRARHLEKRQPPSSTVVQRRGQGDVRWYNFSYTTHGHGIFVPDSPVIAKVRQRRSIPDST